MEEVNQSSEAAGNSPQEIASQPQPADSLLSNSGSPDDQPADSQQADGQDSKQQQDGQQQAPLIPDSPQGYQFGFAPETQVDTALLGKFQTWAHENKLPVEVAAKLAKDFESHVAAQIKAAPEAQAKALQQRRADFSQQAMADPEISNSLPMVQRGFNEFAAEGLHELLASHGLDNHPLVLKTFLSIGKALAEPDLVSGSDAKQEKSAAEVLYPNQK